MSPKALAHPVRVEILAIASRRLISQPEFARQSGLSPGCVGYHFRQLVKQDAIELVSIRWVEGSRRHCYRATADAIDVGLALEEAKR